MDAGSQKPVTPEMKLWIAVQETDPKYTKGFNRSGGFRGTAVNALYLIRKATALWGPMGNTWGIKVQDEKYQPGAPIGNSGHEVVHVIRAALWYPGGVVECYGQTTFVGHNKNGTYTDEEAPKKSLTDALTKGLSWLGFSADVHMGQYDDNKYVAEMKEKYAPKADVAAAETDVAAKIQATTPNGKEVCKKAFDDSSAEEQDFLRTLSAELTRMHKDGLYLADYWQEQKLDNDQKLAIWFLLESNVRSAIKKQEIEQRQKAA